MVAMKLMQISRELAERHYAVHKDKPFYPGLIEYITAGPVVVMIIAGAGTIAISRKMMGKTFGAEAEPGTIRGDFGASQTYNLIHGSDSPESAAMEIDLYFKPEEIVDRQSVDACWIFKPEQK